MLIGLSIDGVLAAGIPPTSSANLLGLSLYRSHDPNTSWAFFTTSRAPRAAIERWLLQEGFSTWVSISTMEDEVEQDPVAWKIRAITRMQAANHKMAMYYDADPSAVRAVSSIGVPSMLVVPPDVLPRYAATYKPWDELVAHISQQQEHAAEQQRRRLRDG